MGILSYHLIFALQLGHLEAGSTIDSSVKALRATTLRKLPIQAPVAKIIKQSHKISITKPFLYLIKFVKEFEVLFSISLKLAFEKYRVFELFESDSYLQSSLKQ